jgi:hypothetical protein
MRSPNFKTMILPIVIGIVIGFLLARRTTLFAEGFQATAAGGAGCPAPAMTGPQTCPSCGTSSCPPVPDMSKYVLKSSIPPPMKCPDMSQYMLKTECPPVPDLSQYVLKSSIPTPEPIIIDNSSCSGGAGKGGECPPCPRPRCPEVKCPPPTVCPACPPCPRQTCPQTTVKCKAEESPSTPIRPYLAPLNFGAFGGN